MTASQCKEARRLLGWSQQQLSSHAMVPRESIVRLELSRPVRNTQSGQARADNIRAAFKAAGVEFTDGDEPGVKLKRPE